MVLVPLPLAVTLLPLGIEALLSFTGWLAWFPAYLVLGALQAAVMVCVYRRVVDWQGDLL